jgi:photosystem II stability/assembly factor-like uncharacterized protein
MPFSSWMRSWLRHTPRAAAARGPRSIRPQLEALEERQLLDATGIPTTTGFTTAFVDGLYRDLLDRTPSTNELNQWMTAPNSNLNPLQVAFLFTTSKEYEDDQIKSTYQHLLGRVPSGAEISLWQSAMQNGLDTEQLTADVLSSDEFYADSGGTPTGWINALYKDVLGRSADASALATAASISGNSSSRLSEAEAVLNSPEGRSDIINSTYQQLLHRPADVPSLDYWSNLLANGLPYLQFTNLVASSPEYQALQVKLSDTTTTAESTPVAAPAPKTSSKEIAHIDGSSSGPASGPTSGDPPATLSVAGTWQQVGPAPLLNGQTAGSNPVSGRVAGLAADPTNANIIYMAAAGGGVWKTTNGGNSWTPLTDNQSTLFMGAIAVAPSDPNVIYAGTGESTNSGLSFYGRGILKSTDGGTTWTLETNGGAFDRLAFSKIVVDPTNANIVYAAVCDNAVNGVLGNTGIWKSTDGGATWTNTTTGITNITPDDDFSDLVIDPSNDQILYCAVGTPGGGVANGVYETTNGGTSWAVSGNFPTGTKDSTIKIAISASNPQVLYAAITDPTTGGLSAIYTTSNGGTTWATVATAPVNYMGTQGDYDSTIAIDPSNSNIVYVGGATDGTVGLNNSFLNSVLETTDGGTTWTDITANSDGTDGVHPDQHAMTFDANGKLLVGNDGGVWRLDNPSTTNVVWTDLNGNLATLQFIGIGLDQQNGSIIYGGTQDNGTEKETSAGVWSLVQYGDGGFVAVDPNNANTVYHTFYRLVGSTSFIERSTDGGATWTDISAGIASTDNSEFYPPYEMDPSNPSRLILGTDHVYETTNMGASWTAIGTPGVNGFNLNTANSEDVTAVAIAPSDPNTIYVASAISGSTGNAHLWVTTNDGASWTQIDIPGVTDHIQGLTVDPTNSKVVYAVRDQFGGGKVFESTNGGTSWTNITANLPDLPAYSLAIDTKDSALFLGNDNGVYVSLNQGASWQVFGTGLPHAQSRFLVYSPTLQVLADGTHGRSVWEISTATMTTGGGGGKGTGGKVLPVIPVPSGNVTGQVKVFYPLRYTYDPQTDTYDGNITILNLEPKNLAGKAVTLAFPDLPSGVTLANATAQLVTGPLAIVVPGATLDSGVALRVKIELSDPDKTPLSSFFIGFPVDVYYG